MKILVLGQNPSRKNTDPNVPFEGTQSDVVLQSWLDQIIPYDYSPLVEVMNCSDRVDFKPTAQTIADLSDRIRYVVNEQRFDKVIALGSIASEILDKAGIVYFPLPHPSGRNRKLNDKTYISEQLELAKRYLE